MGSKSQYCDINFNNSDLAYVILTNDSIATGCQKNSDTLVVKVNSSVAIDSAFVYYSPYTPVPELICYPSDLDSYQWGSEDKTTLIDTFYIGQIYNNYEVVNISDTLSKYIFVMVNQGCCLQKLFFNPPAQFPNNIQSMHQNNKEVLVFPNPSIGSFTIELDENQTFDAISITDIAGRQIPITNKMINQNICEVQLSSNIKSGNYMLSVKSRDIVYHKLITID